MNNKKIYIVETPDPLAGFFGDNKYPVRASDIGSAHRWGRNKFGKGVSFHTREPLPFESVWVSVAVIQEAE